MAYRMARLPMTLSEAEGRFCCFKPSATPLFPNCFGISCTLLSGNAVIAYYVVFK